MEDRASCATATPGSILIGVVGSYDIRSTRITPSTYHAIRGADNTKVPGTLTSTVFTITNEPELLFLTAPTKKGPLSKYPNPPTQRVSKLW